MPRMKSFEEEVAYYEQKRASAIARCRTAFEASSAVRARWGGKHPREEMWILSEDTHPVDEGKERPWRVSRFGKDGPFGHDVGATKDALYKMAGDWGASEVTPMTEAQVIEWTSTREYQEGVKHVAFMQAINTLSWHMGKQVDTLTGKKMRAKYDEAWALAREGDIELATQVAERAARGRENPPLEFVPNPAWVTKAVAENWDKIVAELGPDHLPKFGQVRAARNRISASMKELGCGAYGCVLPTPDPSVVLKVTTDASEMDFVVKILPELPALITTKYFAWKWTMSTRKGQRIGLLWREAADFVGKIHQNVHDGLDVLKAIKAQHEAASNCLIAVLRGQYGALPGLLAVWQAMTDRMSRLAPLAFVGRGMLEAYAQQGVFFADVHEGNLGRVMRDGQYQWVITDPGNVIVIGDEESAGEVEDIHPGELEDLRRIFNVNPSPGNMAEIARQRVLEPLIGERVSHRRQVDLTITPGLRETWDIAYTTGRNIGGNPSGRILIVLPRGDLRDPLAGLVYSTEGGRTYVHHIWVDPDVRRRGLSGVLFNAFRSEFGEELLVAGPFTPAGRAAAESAGAILIP